jgi:hypothetical protein
MLGLRELSPVDSLCRHCPQAQECGCAIVRIRRIGNDILTATSQLNDETTAP